MRGKAARHARQGRKAGEARQQGMRGIQDNKKANRKQSNQSSINRLTGVPCRLTEELFRLTTTRMAVGGAVT